MAPLDGNLRRAKKRRQDRPESPQTRQESRRATFSVQLGAIITRRAREHGRGFSEEAEALVHYALAEETKPAPPPDTPLERRIRELLATDPNLTRGAAERIARAGGHDR